MTAPAHTFADRLAAIHRRIGEACRRAGRNAGDVTLIGVTKTRTADDVREAFLAGLSDFGENRVQEGLPKIDELAVAGLKPHWHFIGHLQTNKVAQVLSRFDLLHSVDSLRLLAAIERHHERTDVRPIDTFIEVNVANEPAKAGISVAELPLLAEAALVSPAVQLRGLMTVAPNVREPEQVRAVFRELRQLAHSLNLHELSMGMTGDFEVAIEEGATHIRVGRALFGERGE